MVFFVEITQFLSLAVDLLQKLPTKQNYYVTVNPYKNLPSVYKNFTADELDNSTTGLNHLADGGTALTAYAKLQFTEVSLQEHNALVEALLRYCELDTLAMVMIYEHFKELTDA